MRDYLLKGSGITSGEFQLSKTLSLLYSEICGIPEGLLALSITLINTDGYQQIVKLVVLGRDKTDRSHNRQNRATGKHCVVDPSDSSLNTVCKASPTVFSGLRHFSRVLFHASIQFGFSMSVLSRLRKLLTGLTSGEEAGGGWGGAVWRWNNMFILTGDARVIDLRLKEKKNVVK